MRLTSKLYNARQQHEHYSGADCKKHAKSCESYDQRCRVFWSQGCWRNNGAWPPVVDFSPIQESRTKGSKGAGLRSVILERTIRGTVQILLCKPSLHGKTETVRLDAIVFGMSHVGMADRHRARVTTRSLRCGWTRRQ